MFKKGKLLICITLALLLSVTGTAVFASAATEPEESLIISETTEGQVHKKEIKNIQKFAKGKRKNKNSKNYLDEVITEYNIEEETLNNAEQMIIQDEIVGISPLALWTGGGGGIGDLPIGGGGAFDPISESDFWTDPEGYIRITTVCTKMSKKTPSGNPIWKIEGTAYSLKSFIMRNNDHFAISYGNNAVYNDMYQHSNSVTYKPISSLLSYETHTNQKIEYSSFGVDIEFPIELYPGLYSPSSISHYIDNVKIVYYMTVTNDTSVRCIYVHNENWLSADITVTVGILGISVPKGNHTPFSAKPVSIYYAS